jgi:hypothetical protein
VIAALTASPIVWDHYLVLLFIPIALLSPSLSAIWLVPVLAGLVPTPHPHSFAQMLFPIALEALVVIRLCRRPKPPILATFPAFSAHTRPNRPKLQGRDENPPIIVHNSSRPPPVAG